jgi:hypothetical protein
MEEQVERADFALNMVEIVKHPESFDDVHNHLERDKKVIWSHTKPKDFEEMKVKGISNCWQYLKTIGYSILNETELNWIAW